MKVLVLKDMPDVRQIEENLFEGYDRDEFIDANSLYDPNKMVTVCLNKYVRLGTVIVDANAYKAIVEAVEHDLVMNSARLKKQIEINKERAMFFDEEEKRQREQMERLQEIIHKSKELELEVKLMQGDTGKIQKQINERTKTLGKKIKELTIRENDIKQRSQKIWIDEIKVRELEVMQSKYTQLKEIFGDVKEETDDEEC